MSWPSSSPTLNCSNAHAKAARGQAQLGQRAGEAEPVYQAERKGDDGAPPAKERTEIVERRQHDRDGDRRLDEPRRQKQALRRRERKRDRVRERERGHDARHRERGLAEGPDRLPATRRTAHDRRQQQA